MARWEVRCEAHAAQLAAGQPVSTPLDLPGVREWAMYGMTCDQCATSVKGEVQLVPRLAGVAVDPEGGRVVVHGDGLSEAAIREAFDRAGYRLVGS
jgi:copper chaperone